jgi:hypothetical protein
MCGVRPPCRPIQSRISRRAPEFPVGCLDGRRYEKRSSIYTEQYDAMIKDLFKLYQNADAVEDPDGREMRP